MRALQWVCVKVGEEEAHRQAVDREVRALLATGRHTGGTPLRSVKACWWCNLFLMMAVRGGSSCLQVVVLPVQGQPVVRVVLLVVAAVGAQQVAEQRDEAGEQRAVRHHAKLAPAPPPCIQHIHTHTRRCQDMVDEAGSVGRQTQRGGRG